MTKTRNYIIKRLELEASLPVYGVKQEYFSALQLYSYIGPEEELIEFVDILKDLANEGFINMSRGMVSLPNVPKSPTM